MKIHEYQAKELLAAAGAAVPQGIVASSAGRGGQGVRPARRQPVVLKAQVHAGGRGKGRFKGSGKDFGGVKFITQARRRRQGRRGHAQVPARHQADRRGGAEGLQGARAGRGRHRPRDLPRHGARPRRRHAGADGLRRGRRGHRGGRRQAPGEDPQGAGRSRTPGLQPYQARRLAYELGFTGEQVPQGREDHDGPGEGVPRQGLHAWPRSTRWS